MFLRVICLLLLASRLSGLKHYASLTPSGQVPACESGICTCGAGPSFSNGWGSGLGVSCQGELGFNAATLVFPSNISYLSLSTGVGVPGPAALNPSSIVQMWDLMLIGCMADFLLRILSYPGVTLPGELFCNFTALTNLQISVLTELQ